MPDREFVEALTRLRIIRKTAVKVLTILLCRQKWKQCVDRGGDIADQT